MFKNIDMDQELTWLHKFNDVNVTLESIEELSSYAQDTINTRASSITPELVASVRANSIHLTNELKTNCEALGIDNPDLVSTRISLESIDDSDQKIALEGIVDSIKKGIKFIFNLILTAIKKVLGLLRIASNIFFEGIFIVFRTIFVAVVKVTNWRPKGTKVSGKYHFENIDAILNTYKDLDVLSTEVIKLAEKAQEDIANFARYLSDGSEYLSRGEKTVKDIKWWTGIFNKENEKFTNTILKLKLKTNTIKVSSKDKRMLDIELTVASPQFHGEVPEKNKFLKVLKEVENTVYPSRINHMESITEKLTEDLTNMLYDFEDANITDRDTNKASKALMLEVSDIRLNITALIITINATYKLIGKDIIGLASKIEEVELPKDFKDQVKKAYKT